MYALKRKTFGKTLVSHQIIRYKLAEMARQIESLQDNLDRIVFQSACGTPDHKMGPQCALLKVQATKTFEYCAREASQVRFRRRHLPVFLHFSDAKFSFSPGVYYSLLAAYYRSASADLWRCGDCARRSGQGSGTRLPRGARRGDSRRLRGDSA